MAENDGKVKRFMSCFISGVEIYEKHIVLTDAGERHMFYVMKNNKEALESFKQWFKLVYTNCIPQQLTVIDYTCIESNDGDVKCIVNKLMSSTMMDAGRKEDGKQA